MSIASVAQCAHLFAHFSLDSPEPGLLVSMIFDARPEACSFERSFSKVWIFEYPFKIPPRVVHTEMRKVGTFGSIAMAIEINWRMMSWKQSDSNI